MRKIIASGLSVILCALIFTSGCLTGTGDSVSVPTAAADDPAKVLSRLTSSINADLSAIDGVIATTAETISGVDLSGSMARAALVAANKRLPAAISLSTIDANGTWLLQVPDNTSGVAGPGEDLSTQEWYATASAGNVPLMTDYFALAQGGYGVAIIHPVTGVNGTSGYISMAFDPSALISPRARAIENETDFTVMVLQEDGVILYDADTAEIGSNTYENPEYAAYPSLIERMEAIATNPAGTGSYTWYATGTTVAVTKDIWWNTVALHGTEWRIALIQERT